MAHSCWACGQQNDGGFTHCVNPACGLPLSPARPAPPDTSVMRTRPCYLRMLVLPVGITMVIILAAVHALMAQVHGPLQTDHANSQLTPLMSAPPTAAGPAVSPTGPVAFPLPSQVPAGRPPAGAPHPGPSVFTVDEGPASGPYHMRSLSGGCFDIGYTSTGQTPMFTQKPCSPDTATVRFELEALGSGRYRMTAVPQRGITAGQALCVSSAGTDRMVVLDGCASTRDDQVVQFVETAKDWYQLWVDGGCVTATGRDARTRACGSSQAQRFTFTPAT